MEKFLLFPYNLQIFQLHMARVTHSTQGRQWKKDIEYAYEERGGREFGGWKTVAFKIHNANDILQLKNP